VTDANNPNWLRHGEKTLLGIARASGGNAYGSKDNKHGPLWIMRGFLGIKMDVSENGELPSEFEEGHKKLIPLIFLHGISSNRSMNTGTCKDLASHGYIVFTMDHEDGTCSYTKSEDGSKE
jgi:dienelactone hydrolase